MKIHRKYIAPHALVYTIDSTPLLKGSGNSQQQEDIPKDGDFDEDDMEIL